MVLHKEPKENFKLFFYQTQMSVIKILFVKVSKNNFQKILF